MLLRAKAGSVLGTVKVMVTPELNAQQLPLHKLQGPAGREQTRLRAQ